MADLAARVEALWEQRDRLEGDDESARATVHEAIDLLDRGEVRVAEIVDGQVVVHEWLRLAILLLFRLGRMETVELGPFEYADKIPLKRGYEAAGVRVVPGASARWGAHLEPGVIMMPSYVNIGARVGRGTMVDTWATVGSCAQIGRNVHLSGGVGIGGVLEPPGAAPVMVGDECLIGSRCVVADGARVGDGVVLGAGCVLTGSIPVIEAWSGTGGRARRRPTVDGGGGGHTAAHLPGRPRVRAAVRAAPQAAGRGSSPRQERAQRRPARSRRHAVTETASVGRAPLGDLLALTAHLVDIPSESHSEEAITDLLEAELAAGAPWLTVDRVGSNLVARTELGRPHRLIVAGHTDTVPVNGNLPSRQEGDVLWGCGAVGHEVRSRRDAGAGLRRRRSGRRRHVGVLRSARRSTPASTVSGACSGNGPISCAAMSRCSASRPTA